MDTDWLDFVMWNSPDSKNEGDVKISFRRDTIIGVASYLTDEGEEIASLLFISGLENAYTVTTPRWEILNKLKYNKQ